MHPSPSPNTAARLVELSFAEYAQVRSEYWRSINGFINNYLREPTVTDDSFKGWMRALVEAAFLRAGLIAWSDGGSDRALTVSALAYITARKLAEFGYIESLVLSLRLQKFQSRSEEEREQALEIDFPEIARIRADGYSGGLDILYNNTKVRGAGELMLLFAGDDGMESCFDCQKYKSKRHPASWWIRHNAVPPNRDFECKGYNCLHVLVDPKGHIFTL